MKAPSSLRTCLAVLAALLLAGCAARHLHSTSDRAPQVRYRYGSPSDDAGRWLLEQLPDARWDLALLAAARELTAAAADPSARLTPGASHLATSRAGFPGDARFSRLYNGGAFPASLLEDARAVQGDADGLDVALANRRFGDGTVQWVLGVAPHWGEIDPLPRELGLDDPLSVQVEVKGTRDLTLFVAPPSGPVHSLSFREGVARWVDLFHLPGEYLLEVVDTAPGRSRVLFDFAVFVEQQPGPMQRLPVGIPVADPIQATRWLYEALDDRRRDAGLPRLQRFEPFEPLAREHSALMASSGVLAHVIPGVTEGVGANAWQRFHPRARHYEDLAAAYSAQEALELAWASPGHRRNLLCETCTHVSIGVALEPVAAGPARLFVTWELLAFPQGQPRRIERPQ